MNEVEYKQAIKDARRLGNQIQYRHDVIEKAQAEVETMDKQRWDLIKKIKAYEAEQEAKA